jgi:hypothetical protein
MRFSLLTLFLLVFSSSVACWLVGRHPIQRQEEGILALPLVLSPPLLSLGYDLWRVRGVAIGAVVSILAFLTMLSPIGNYVGDYLFSVPRQ